MAPTGHCHRWAGTEGERWVAAGRASGLVGLGPQWGLGRRQIAWLRGRPARLWQEQEGVRGGAIFLYGDVIYSGGKKFRQALKSHAFQALVPLLFHLADTCPEVVTVSGLACLSSSAWVAVVSRHRRCRRDPEPGRPAPLGRPPWCVDGRPLPVASCAGPSWVPVS